jgi:biotin operon repressor
VEELKKDGLKIEENVPEGFKKTQEPAKPQQNPSKT